VLEVASPSKLLHRYLHHGAAEVFAVDNIFVSSIEVTLRATLQAVERQTLRGSAADPRDDAREVAVGDSPER
jgi:hypothetical protein